jgi:hypothetical protein
MTLNDLDDLPKAPPKEKTKAYQKAPEQEQQRATTNQLNRGTIDESDYNDDPRQSALYYAKLKEKDYPRDSVAVRD